MHLNRILSTRYISSLTVAFGALLLCFIWGGLYFKVQAEQRLELDNAMKDTGRLALALAEHTERTLGGLDEMALFLKYQAETVGLPRDLSSLAREQRFARQPFRIFGMLNEQGDLVASSVAPFVPTNSSEREIFTAHAQAASGKLFVGQPLLGKVSGKYTIQVSRRVDKPDGSFGGVVFIGIDPNYFAEFYKQVDLGAKSSITIIGRDGIVRVRQSGQEIQFGMDFRTRVREAMSAALTGSYVDTGIVDGVRRVFSYRHLREYPLIVAVGMDEAAVFQDLNRRTEGYYWVGGAMTAAVALYIPLLLYAVRRRSQAEEQVHLLLDSTAEAIYGIDLNGDCTFANRSCLNMLGYERLDQLIGKNMHRLIHYAYADGRPMDVEECKIYRAFHQGENMHVDDEVLWRADGSSFPVEYWSYPQWLGSRVVGAVVTFYDITELRKVEQERKQLQATLELKVLGRTAKLSAANQDLEALNVQMMQLNEHLDQLREAAETANRAKSCFIAAMSHELRTPLHAILGLSHVVSQTDLPPAQHSHLEKIQAAGQTLLGLINDILDFAKSEDAKLVMARTPFRLTGLLERVAAELAAKAAAKGLDFTVKATPGIPSELIGDPQRLRQVLNHLAGNAVKFTEIGGVTLQVARATVDTGEAAGVMLHFSVRDTGIGINADQREKLFQTFTQLDEACNRRYGGAGLGLAISRRLVNLMGGEIWVESSPGQGSTFHFTARFGVGDSAAQGTNTAIDSERPAAGEPTAQPASSAVSAGADRIEKTGECAESAETVLGRLRECLETFDAEATELFATAVRCGYLAAAPAEQDQLRKCIERYDFDKALVVLDKLLSDKGRESSGG